MQRCRGRKCANEFGRAQVIPSSLGISCMKKEPGDESGKGGRSQDLSQRNSAASLMYLKQRPRAVDF